MTLLAIALAFILGIWAGLGWRVAELRVLQRQHAELEAELEAELMRSIADKLADLRGRLQQPKLTGGNA